MPRFQKKKRKGFPGKRWADIVQERKQQAGSHLEGQQASSSSQEGSSALLKNLENVSARKLTNTDFKRMEGEHGTITRSKSKKLGCGSDKTRERAFGFKLQDSTILGDVLSRAAICRACKNSKSKLELWQQNNERCGLAESLFLKCSECGDETAFSTSGKLPGQGGAFEVNRRSVMALEGGGRERLSKFCSKMNLPPPVNKKAYNQHLKSIEKASASCAEKVMGEACTRLKDIIEKEDPEKIEVDENGNKTANVAVTVDGTWQKRGHSSKIGVAFVLSVRTGEVLDFEVLSHICHECVAHKHLDSASDEYKQWHELHKDKCQINHVGSSGDMETKGAIAMFSRSVDRGLKYTTFVGDGDSSCYGNVHEAMIEEHGESYTITKEECVGHVQKRMGTALLGYKKSKKGVKLGDGKGVGGAGRLTEDMIKRIQNYYGFAIRQNQGDLEGMRKAVWAIKHHLIESSKESLEMQHRFCPKTKGTWCKFWSDKLEGTSKYNTAGRLPEVFMKELAPIFKRLSGDELLKRCLKGLTQNQNESLNGLLWSKVSKTMFCGKRKVTNAVSETVCIFNTGAASKASIMLKFGLVPGSHMMKSLRKEDSLRISRNARKISKKYRTQRKLLRLGKKKKRIDNAYKSGSYGLGTEPEVAQRRKKLKKDNTTDNATKKRKRNAEQQLVTTESDAPSTSTVGITFVADEEVEPVLKRNK